MKKINEFDRESFLSTILCLKNSINVNLDFGDISEFKRLTCGSILYLLEFIFGETKSRLIWDFVTESEDNKFQTINELYNYIVDPYSNLVTQSDSVLTLSQLREMFPEEPMFQFFEKIVNEKDNI